MEKITSRKNEIIQSLRCYSGEDLLCCGMKMLEEALQFGAEITSILWKEVEGPSICPREYVVPADLFDYVAPLKNSPGPLFTAKVKEREQESLHNAIVLENVQDPGNVGTVIRTANAFHIDAVVLVGSCASLSNPKTVRASMGACFRQTVIHSDLNNLPSVLDSLPLYGAVLADDSVNITKVNIMNSAVAIGSEGKGLSEKLIELCSGKLIIPMNPDSESLNAAVAAAVFMWEMAEYHG